MFFCFFFIEKHNKYYIVGFSTAMFLAGKIFQKGPYDNMGKAQHYALLSMPVFTLQQILFFLTLLVLFGLSSHLWRMIALCAYDRLVCVGSLKHDFQNVQTVSHTPSMIFFVFSAFTI